MIMPLCLPGVDDKRFVNICVKHINKGLLKGVDFALEEYKTVDDRYIYFQRFLPRGFHGDGVAELYRLRDILTSKMLYVLGDFDMYMVMTLLNNFCRNDIAEYTVAEAQQLTQVDKCLNIHVIGYEPDRNHVLRCLEKYCVEMDETIDDVMARIEDLNRYTETCFECADFLNLGDFSVEEIKALSTMKEYANRGFVIRETELHLPYVVLK